jgi:hypothetical protein
VDVVVTVLNILLATAMWFILGRLVLRLFIRNPANAIWQMFLIITEPPYRVSRAITAGRVPEGWIWLVSLVWLFAARLALTRLYTALAR